MPSVALFETAELLVQLHAVHLTQHASLSNLGTFFPDMAFRKFVDVRVVANININYLDM